MPSIVILKSGESTTHDLSLDETVIGRLPECQIQIDSNMVSRKHARIVRDGNQFLVEDLGSGNGTTVNGVRIAARTLLKHDDRVKLGPILIRFVDQAAAPQNRVPPPARPPAAASPPESQTATFQFDMAEEAEDSATITGAVGGTSAGRFGALDVQPAAKLKGILEISRTLAGTVDLNALLPKILDTLFTIFPGADRGCILLKEGANGQMIPRAIKHSRPGEDESVKLSRTIVNKVLTDKTGVLSADAASDSRFQASESIANFTIRSMMCVPLLGLDGEPLGIINIDTQNPLKQFQTDDLDLLLAVAGQAALSYENARLVVSYTEKVKQDNEMQIAQGVQRALLPESLPQVAGYEFFATYESAQAVGGDYYDCFMLPGGKRVAIAFGDVAGKGVPAALVVSRLSSAVQSTMEFVPDVGEALAKINDHMCAHAVEGRFVTFTLAIIDTESHEMSLSIAGHMSPMVRKIDGAIEEFPEEAVGMPLGVVAGMPYDVLKRTLQPGETVVLYTDGVSEAMNHGGDLYTPERLRDVIAKNSPVPSALGKIIRDDVRKHADGRYQNDDITLMVYGRTAS
ncbi:MAG: SpoIIE family protein phosphatase [Planctomycetia bacterium]|nr:SpoIIE family protein phosphatase [Planctomycetia bacterium]